MPRLNRIVTPEAFRTPEACVLFKGCCGEGGEPSCSGDNKTTCCQLCKHDKVNAVFTRESMGSPAPALSSSSADTFFSSEEHSAMTSCWSQEVLVKLELLNCLPGPRIDVAMLKCRLIKGTFIIYKTAICSSVSAQVSRSASETGAS